MGKIMTYLKNNKMKLRNCMNLTDTLKPVRFHRNITGIALFVMEQGTDNVVRPKINIYGLPGFVGWISAFIYCSYRIYTNDLSILRNLYDTKLQQYGGVLEFIISVPVTFYCGAWKLAFDLNYNIYYLQEGVNVDIELQKLGVIIDYNKFGYTVLMASTAQLIVFIIRFATVMKMSIEITIQGAMVDGLGALVTTFYCFQLIAIRDRYKAINNLFTEINERRSLEHIMFLRGSPPANMQRALQLQDQYISAKIKASAGIYSMIYNMTTTINKKFGLALSMTMFQNLFSIILHMFYFMEATASGMYVDTLGYMYLLVYLFWRIGYSFGISYINIYISETVVREASRTSYIAHDIINSGNELNPSVIEEAMRLSWQLFHERPVFTACGLFKISYELLLEGARSVTTFLVMLLQYATN